MSATNRKKRKNGVEVERTARVAQNHYPTDNWCTRVLVERCGFAMRGKRVLECAAGDGSMVNVLADAGAIVDAVEIDVGRADIIRRGERARHVHRGDFLSPSTDAWLKKTGALPYDAVITNPPYGEWVQFVNAKGEPKFRYRDLALEFAERAILLAPVVCFLLRLNWAGSQPRHAFHAKHPADLVVFSNRPRFRPDGKSDAAEYAWWIWRRGSTIGTWTVHLSAEAPTRGRPKGEETGVADV